MEIASDPGEWKLSARLPLVTRSFDVFLGLLDKHFS